MTDTAKPPGLFALLTPEQRAYALEYDGPESFGDEEFRINKEPPMTDTPACLPPGGTEPGTYHWLCDIAKPEHTFLLLWRDRAWFDAALGAYSPTDAYSWGYRYLCPADFNTLAALVRAARNIHRVMFNETMPSDELKIGHAVDLDAALAPFASIGRGE